VFHKTDVIPTFEPADMNHNSTSHEHAILKFFLKQANTIGGLLNTYRFLKVCDYPVQVLQLEILPSVHMAYKLLRVKT